MKWWKNMKGKGLQKNSFLVIAIIGLLLLLMFSPEDSSLLFDLGDIFVNSDSDMETDPDFGNTGTGRLRDTGTSEAEMGLLGNTGLGTTGDLLQGNGQNANNDMSFVYTNPLQTGIEYRLETMLNQMEGIENATILITFSETDNVSSKQYDYTYSYPPIEGILVVMDNGNDSERVLLVTHAIQALFSIEAHKIEVINRI